MGTFDNKNQNLMWSRNPSSLKQQKVNTGLFDFDINIITKRNPPLYQDQTPLQNTQLHQEYQQISPYYNSVYPKDHHHSLQSFLTPQQIKNQYVSTLEQNLYSETYSNIQKIVFDNTQIINQLILQNQRLYKHLQNFKALFQIKLKNKRNQHLISQQKNPQESNNQKISQKDKLKKAKNFETGSVVEEIKKVKKNKMIKVKTSAVLGQNKLQYINETPNPNEKILPLPYKGSVNYTDQKWIVEQNFVMGFLNMWMINNVQYTTDKFCTIEKRQILNKYIKWKQTQQFSIKNYLQSFKIQQILTNEIKAMFGCSCTLRQYTGLVFTNQFYRTKQQQTVKRQEQEKHYGVKEEKDN